MSAICQIQALLSEYSRLYRRKELQELRVSALYDLCTTKKDIVGDPQLSWAKDDYWPDCDRYGIYAIFDDSLSLLYIGKASMNNPISNRLGRWFGRNIDGTCRIKDLNWSRPPRYVATAAVDDDMRFEAAAIEEYLIMKLVPIDNTRGKLQAKCISNTDKPSPVLGSGKESAQEEEREFVPQEQRQ